MDLKLLKNLINNKKKDAVRRCSSEGYECEKIAIEKIKHFVSKEALILMVWKKNC